MNHVIEDYPNIKDAYILMESCNGGLWGPRGPWEACRDTDIYLQSYTREHLTIIDQWLSTLNEEQLLTFIDGEESEMLELVHGGGFAGQSSNYLFNHLFDGEPHG